MLNSKKFKQRLNGITTNLVVVEDEQTPYLIFKFNISIYSFKIYSKENIVKRSKYCRQYETFLEILDIDEKEGIIIENSMKHFFNCKTQFYKRTVNAHVCHVINYDRIIEFLENIEVDSIENK